jgi:hypothetical protein
MADRHGRRKLQTAALTATARRRLIATMAHVALLELTATLCADSAASQPLLVLMESPQPAEKASA